MKHFALLFITALTLVGCDANISMAYVVKNKSNAAIRLHIPNFPTHVQRGFYGAEFSDTTLLLEPDSTLFVGLKHKIDFPWGAKNIYRATPGICGIELIEADTTYEVDCSAKNWKYRRGMSIVTFK